MQKLPSRSTSTRVQRGAILDTVAGLQRGPFARSERIKSPASVGLKQKRCDPLGAGRILSGTDD